MNWKFIIITVLLIFSISIQAQWVQLGDVINGNASLDYSGQSVSLSSDGSILAIGAYRGGLFGGGYVRVFELSNGNWDQIGEDINSESHSDNAGWSISLNSDGSIIAIGAPSNSALNGQVRIYKYINGVWEQIGQDIDGDEEHDFFGYSVSLSADGSIVAVGAIENFYDFGYVRVFGNDAGTWQQIGGDMIGVLQGAYFGHSVSLNSDGSIVAIGAPNNENVGNNIGHASIFENNSGIWQQIDSDIFGEEQNDFFGYSVSLNSEGSRVAIGAPKNAGQGGSTHAGHVRIFENNVGTWQQLGEDINGEFLDNSGHSISLNSEGNVVAIGAPKHSGDTGCVRIYNLVNGSWNQFGSSINGVEYNDYFGKAVSLNSDGSIFAAGAPENDENGYYAGQVSVYSNLSIGITDIVDSKVLIYPIPVKRFLNIESLNDFEISVTDMMGKTIKQLSKRSTILIIDLLENESGVYFLRISNDKFYKTIKIIKE